jgi:Ser/Thr protein kinase RdoA (MazF antagonist)
MAEALTTGRHLRQVARAALASYGVAPAQLVFLDCKQPAFRVRVAPRSARASRNTHYTDNTYLLRIFPEGTRHRDTIRSELQWLGNILSATRIVVPKPVAGRGGEPVVTVSAPGDSHPYHCALTHWVKGRFFIRKTGPGASALRLVGRAMARLHIHGQQFKRGSAFRCPRWDEEGLFGDQSPYFPDAEKHTLALSERRLFSKVVENCRAVMERLGSKRDDFGLVHGDLIQLNYLFYQGEVRIIDFGDFGYAHYLFDMAVTLFALLDLDQDGGQRRAFLEGYREVRHFSDEHESLLDVFLAARGVLLARYVIGISGGQLSEPGVRYVNRVINGIRMWANSRQAAK